MKGNRLTMRGFVMLAFLAICSIAAAQMPTGFPTMPNTGNPSADAEAYEQAKQVWIANNPTSPVNQTTVAAQPTEQENEAYEANKVQAIENQIQGRQAAKQLEGLEATFRANHEDWLVNNGRLHQAYLDAFAMARGQSVVNITALEYANLYQELRGLVDANPALFVVTQ